MGASAGEGRGSRAAHPTGAPRLVLGFFLLGCGCAEPPGARSVLLVTLDTTRADALSCYGNPEPTTPVLDALAAEGVLFEAAHTSVPLTLPAHASMFTGLAPLRHGVRVNGEQALAGAAQTLAERARAAGVATAAFVGSVALDPAFGLAQGFELYSVPDAPHAARRGRAAERSARDTLEAALPWLAALDPARPFFLWVHLYDPHEPYTPSEPFAGRFSTPYLGEVAAMDHELGRLLAALRASGRDEETFVLVVGDHGEAFGEHGELGHGLGAYESTLRIPMLARWPARDRRRPAGTRTRELVGVVDVAPTLAEALALAPFVGIDGQSFYSHELAPGRGLYFETYHAWLTRGWSPLAGWIDEHGKYLHSSAPELYAWRSDPMEAQDLVHTRAAEAERYRAEIRRLAALPALAPVESGAPEARQALEELGYSGAQSELEAWPEPLAPSSAESPHAGLGHEPPR